MAKALAILSSSFLFVLLACGTHTYAREHIPSIDLSKLKDGPISASAESLLYSESQPGFSIQTLIHRNDLTWHKADSDIPGFGFSNLTHWMRFSVSNKSQKTQQFLMDVAYPLLNDIQVYQVRYDNTIVELNAGDERPFSTRPIEHRDFLFTLSIPPGVTDDIYLRVVSSSAIQLPVYLWDQEQFFSQDQLKIYVNGSYAGIVFIMVIYNFFLFLKIRDTAYLYYVCYAAAFALMQMTISGFSYQYLWPDWVTWNEISIAVLIPLCVIFGAPFASRMLELEDYHPILYRVMQMMVCVGLICLLLSLVLPYGTIVPYAAANAGITAGLGLSIALYAWAKHPTHHTGLFIMGWSFFLVGSSALALSKLGILDRNFLTEYAAQIGSAIEVCLFSYALAARFQNETNDRLLAQREANAANKRLLETEIENRARLEGEVIERTGELQRALENVQHLNRELEKISKTDALTGTKNRYQMLENIESELRRSRRTGRACSLMLIDIDHFKQINDRFGHPTGDACIKHAADTIRKFMRVPPDEIYRYGGEEFLVLLPETSEQAALAAAERIRREMAETPFHQGQIIHYMTVSIGFLSIPPYEEQLSTETIIERADIALYEAKNSGRNTCMMYSDRLDKGSVNHA